MVTNMLGTVYWQDNKAAPGAIPESSDTAIKVATSGGTVIGQLGFGFLADVVGRKKMYGLELILIIFATLAQSLSSDSPSVSIVGVLIFWRVLMGIGIGGGKSIGNGSQRQWNETNTLCRLPTLQHHHV
jgi:PHS family inorganic phosphate transporter-like MFS transporter